MVGFLAGNLNKEVQITFGKQQQKINFSEIVENWLLAKEIIIQSKLDLSLEATNIETQDLSLISTEGNLQVDGGVAHNMSDTQSSSMTFGLSKSAPTVEFSQTQNISESTTHGMSRFKVSNNLYISAM